MKHITFETINFVGLLCYYLLLVYRSDIEFVAEIQNQKRKRFYINIMSNENWIKTFKFKGPTQLEM